MQLNTIAWAYEGSRKAVLAVKVAGARARPGLNELQTPTRRLKKRNLPVPRKIAGQTKESFA